jgi:hypothetical protein
LWIGKTFFLPSFRRASFPSSMSRINSGGYDRIKYASPDNGKRTVAHNVDFAASLLIVERSLVKLKFGDICAF